MYPLLGFLGTLLIQLLIGAFVYGRLTQKVKSHDTEIGRLRDGQETHDREIGELYGAAGIPREVTRRTHA